MGYRITVSDQDGIPLKEAIAVVNGFLLPENVAKECRRYIKETAEAFSVIEMAEREQIVFGDSLLPVLKPLHIEGNHALLYGNGGMGFVWMSSDICMSNIRMEHFSTAVMMNGHGGTISGLTIRECSFRDFSSCCVMTGSDLPESVVRKVVVENCIFEGTPEQKVEGISDWFVAPVGIMLLAASCPDDRDICDCVVEEVEICNCTFRGRHRNSINTIPAAFATESEKEAIHYSDRCMVRDIAVRRCNFEGAYDATINVMGSYMHNRESLTENVEVCDCHLIYNIWGIYFCAAEPGQGTVDGATVRNVNVHHNELCLRAGGSGEDSAALAIQSGRLDYADGAKGNHGIVENIKMNDNVIHHTQHGIFFNGADSMVDGKETELIGNLIRNAEICRNRLYDVDDCFTFYGVQMEGRRVDVRLGIPPRTMRWLPPLESNAEKTGIARENRIEGVVCKDNYCRQYKYKYKIAGARAGGHGIAADNGVDRDLLLEHNIFEDGEGHILVEDQIVWDWVDAAGNYTAEQYRK